jgi:hypothetical protein
MSMSDEVKKIESSQDEPEAQKKSLEGKSVDELLDIIKSTRNEAKERRLKEKELSDKLAELQSKFEQDEQAKKIAEGKKDEVILELQQKLKTKDDEYKPYIEKATKYDEYDSSKRNQLKEILKDDWLSSFENMPLIELETLASKFSFGVKLPDTDNGKNKKGVGKDYFTMEELKRLTPSELADKDVLAKANRSLEIHSKK